MGGEDDKLSIDDWLPHEYDLRRSKPSSSRDAVLSHPSDEKSTRARNPTPPVGESSE